ncbi:MAG: TerC family protein [Betaproteobacteria bacterium]|jgi:predicted tellurium resistance membrane protein TerC|nr:TerC family protein [Betaproteobacteria bacterium]MBT7562101.1 TerC family protein [Pseudomonadota bacterium]MDC3409035.1 TerC family protein [Burkholderiales bacterium]MBT5670609.1 TerC family protein [Betaproteobacteria bacterium]MBT6183170.1 TerC family protein [Betaproteobacteria bacterium]
MFDWIASPEAWIALGTLTALEIVLGIDNIIFLSILVNRLPERQRNLARRLGLSLAMIARLGLLFSLSWVMSLREPIISFEQFSVSGRDLILFFGGLFLIGKAVQEIYEALTGMTSERTSSGRASLLSILIQIAILDIVFSLDSVITAVGLVDQLSIMVIAIVAAVGVMMFAAEAIGNFVDRHPTIKILALAFLILVGVVLVFECFQVHIPKSYIYFAMAFSLSVELINIKTRLTQHKSS